MAFDNDKSSLVPEPPPPRPARRDAAIEAAMRRFDGIAERPPARPPMPWARKHRPQFAMAVSAGLIAVIGLPLALMTIRDRPVTPTEEITPATTESRLAPSPCVGQDCVAGAPAAPEMQGAPPPAARVAEAPSMTPPPARPPIRADRGNALAFGENSQLTKSVAVSPPAIVAPAPQPPPPPAVAEKFAQDALEGQVVVTGSLIAAPAKSAVGREKRDRSAGVAAGRTATKTKDAEGAADWIVQDKSYATFLTRLQAAVSANDRNAVVRLIAFPLRVNFKGRSQLYRDARSLGRDYDRIFTPRVRRAILNQRFDRLFGRDQGVMIGNGEVWFDHSCPGANCSTIGPVRIKAVNP